MKVRLLGFGSIDVDGREYEHDIVIEGGRVREAREEALEAVSTRLRAHTTVGRRGAPWGGSELIVGTGVHGSLPVMPEVAEEAGRRGVRLTAIPTADACRLIAGLDSREVRAVLHVTC